MNDAAFVGGAAGLEQQVKGRPELACDLAIVRDEEAFEESLVDHAARSLWSHNVGRVEVGDEAEGALEIPLDDIELELKGPEPLLNVVEFIRQPLLFASQEVEGNRTGVVSFEQLGALVQDTALPGHETLALGTGILPQVGNLFEDLLLGLEPQVLT